MNILIKEIKIEKMKMENTLNKCLVKIYTINEEIIENIESYGLFTNYMKSFDYKGYGFRKFECLNEDGINTKTIDLVKIDSNGKYKRFCPILIKEELMSKIVKSLDVSYSFFNERDLFELILVIDEFYENINTVIYELIDKMEIEDNFGYMGYIEIN